jgi:hypothetical protein
MVPRVVCACVHAGVAFGEVDDRNRLLRERQYSPPTYSLSRRPDNTCAPCCEKMTATARPMPVNAPVMKTTCVFINFLLGRFSRSNPGCCLCAEPARKRLAYEFIHHAHRMDTSARAALAQSTSFCSRFLPREGQNDNLKILIVVEHLHTDVAFMAHDQQVYRSGAHRKI